MHCPQDSIAPIWRACNQFPPSARLVFRTFLGTLEGTLEGTCPGTCPGRNPNTANNDLVFSGGDVVEEPRRSWLASLSDLLPTARTSSYTPGRCGSRVPPEIPRRRTNVV